MSEHEKLAELRARVEATSGPDREIDAAIAVALGEIKMRGSDERGYVFFHLPIKPGDGAFLSGCNQGREDALTALATCLSLKSYTASLDAAIALVEAKLPGWQIITVTKRWTGPGSPQSDWGADARTHWAEAHLRMSEHGYVYSDARAPTPALALLAAMLRALEALEAKE